jgi:hypothetical protein
MRDVPPDRAQIPFTEMVIQPAGGRTPQISCVSATLIGAPNLRKGDASDIDFKESEILLCVSGIWL